jgi:hypothetical protein
MHTKEHEHYIKEYEAKLEELEAEADQMEAKDRAEFEAERDNFRGQLSAWGDYAEGKWDEFTANIEQGWHRIQGKFHKR